MIELYQGDCFSYLDRIADKSVDLILTDIPYGISKSNGICTMPDRKGRHGIDFGAWDYDFDLTALAQLQSKIKPNGSFITFHAFEQLMPLQETLVDLQFKDLLVWEKTNPLPLNRDRRYIVNIELASWFVAGKDWKFHRQNENYDAVVMKYPSESGGGYVRFHPCQKSQMLLRSLILRHTDPGDTIFDPFMGSGSTGVAAKALGRNFIGIELDENYFRIAKERIESDEVLSEVTTTDVVDMKTNKLF